ncbi:hypothetical protein [Reichenbachiella sp. MALMAid0571]|uniref:hypothetical protein n=1 Tax=Reichenbachiella sp. MALMAid0571 TaxID=3143939 RepID=UPI0032DFF499
MNTPPAYSFQGFSGNFLYRNGCRRKRRGKIKHTTTTNTFPDKIFASLTAKKLWIPHREIEMMPMSDTRSRKIMQTFRNLDPIEQLDFDQL